MKEIIFKYMKEHGFGEFNPKAVLFDMDGVLYNKYAKSCCGMAGIDETV